MPVPEPEAPVLGTAAPLGEEGDVGGAVRGRRLRQVQDVGRVVHRHGARAQDQVVVHQGPEVATALQKKRKVWLELTKLAMHSPISNSVCQMT